MASSDRASAIVDQDAAPVDRRDPAEEFAHLRTLIEGAWDRPVPELPDWCRRAADLAAVLGDQPGHVEMLRRLTDLTALRRAGSAEVLALLNEARAAASGAPLLEGWVAMDVARIGGLDGLARAAAYQDAAAAFGRADEPRRETPALILAANVLIGADRRLEALALLERAWSLARSAGLADLVASCDTIAADALHGLGRLGPAEDLARRSLAVAEASDDVKARTEAGITLAEILLSSGHVARCDEAAEIIGRARDDAKRNNDLASIGRCTRITASARAIVGRMDEAGNLYFDAERVSEAAGADADAAFARLCLADDLLDAGLAEDALAASARALAGAEALGMPDLIGSATVIRARALTHTGDPAEGLRLLDALGPYCEGTDHVVEKVEHLLAYATVHNALDNVEATREYAQRSIDALCGVRLVLLHARALEFLAECAFHDGDHVRARATFGEALALYVIAGRERHARRIAARIAPKPPNGDTGARIRTRPGDLPTGMYL